MLKLVVSLCALVLLATASVSAWAGEPTSGTLSVERGKGLVVIDFRGSVLGRLTSGTLRVTDQTPNDRYGPLVTGKKVTQERIGPRTVLYKGQGLRFRLVGGGYRMVARGSGISVSAVGRGVVVLDGEPRWPGDDVGIYARDGSDCSSEPEKCIAIPTEPERFTLEPAPTDAKPKQGPGS